MMWVPEWFVGDKLPSGLDNDNNTGADEIEEFEEWMDDNNDDDSDWLSWEVFDYLASAFFYLFYLCNYV